MDLNRIYYHLLQTIILFFFFFFCLAGCNIFSDDSDSFYFNASLDGNKWEGTPSIEFYNDTTIIFGIKEPGPETVSMRIDDFDGEGLYNIFNNSYSIFLGGDVIMLSAHSFDSTGTVTIHKIWAKRKYHGRRI